MNKKQLVPSKNELVYYFTMGGHRENRLSFIWDLGKVLVWVWRENKSLLDAESREEYSKKWDPQVLNGLLWGWRGVPGVVMKEESEKAGWGER